MDRGGDDQDDYVEEGSQKSNIRSIVDLVKSGKINKTDAFNELRSMLKNPNRAKSLLDDEPLIPNVSESVEISKYDVSPDKSVGSERSGFSREDRRILINKLIEKKRQARLQTFGNSINTIDNNALPPNFVNEVPETNEVDFRKDERLYDNQHNDAGRIRSYRDENDIGFDLQFKEARYSPSTISSKSGVRSRSLERPRSAGKLRESYDYRVPSFDERRTSREHVPVDIRRQRVEATVKATRDEMFKEYTFQPQVKPLPPSYGPLKEKDAEFTDRVMRWQREKMLELARKRGKVEQEEVMDCTFRPKINRNSEKSVKITRGVRETETASERLYKTSTAIKEQKAKILEEERKRMENLEQLECTFQPKIKTNRGQFNYVEPRYSKPISKTPSQSDAQSLKECTFTPKVKGVRRSMSSAKLYVSTDVVERLTRPVSAGAQRASDDSSKHFDNNERQVLDVASFMGTQLSYNTPGGRKRPSSAPKERSKSAERRSLSPDERESRNQNFKEFLGRQAQMQLRRERMTEEAKLQNSHEFKPSINNFSKKIADRHHKGEFIDRVQRDLLRREESEKKNHVRPPDFTFTPTVTEKANSMRSKSLFELSRGDYHKKETNQKLIRLKYEQEELANMTFQPKISELAQEKAKSVLQLKNNPSGFLERHKLELDKQRKHQTEMKLQKQKQELESCTFQPATKECPAYIKRIAKSLAIVKSVKNEEEIPSKPQWK